MSRNKIVYETELDSSGVKKGASEVSSSVKKTEGDVGGLTSSLDKMTGGLVTGLKGAATGARTFVTGLKSVKVALAATGIGLLVVAVGSLVMFFTKTQKGAELLEVATAALGAVFGKLTDAASAIGGILVSIFTEPGKAIKDFGKMMKEFVMDRVTNLMDGLGFLGSAITKLFSGDFSGAMDDAAKGVGNLAMANPALALMVETVDAVAEGAVKMAKEISTAAASAARLQRRSIALRESQRALNLETAKSRAEIKGLRKDSEDEKLSIEDRIKAAEQAAAIEDRQVKKRIANAEEAVRIQRAQMAITESLEEDFVKLNELEIAAQDIKAGSLRVQTQLLMLTTQLRKEQEAANKAAAKAEQDLLNALYTREEKLDEALSTAEEKEIAAVVKKYEALFALSDEFGRGEEALQEQQREALKKINDKYNKTEVVETAKTEKTKQELRMQTINKVNKMSQAAAGLALALLKGGEEADEATAKKRFETGKKIQLAAAVMSTAQAVIAALSAPPVGLGFPAGLPGAITAGITGATSIATISQQRFSGGPSDIPDPSSAPPPDASIADVAAQSPSINLDFLGDGSSQSGIRAYVVSQNITDAQQSEQLLNDQMSLA